MSTHFRLDYVTGEAMVGNQHSHQQTEMIMTSVEAVASSGLLGEIEERIGTARRVCEAGR